MMTTDTTPIALLHMHKITSSFLKKHALINKEFIYPGYKDAVPVRGVHFLNLKKNTKIITINDRLIAAALVIAAPG